MAGGAIIHGDDGSIYFIRDELLSACKVEGEYIDNVEKLMAEDEVEGFAYRLTSMSTAKPVSYVSGSLLESASAPKIYDWTRTASTIMCPW